MSQVYNSLYALFRHCHPFPHPRSHPHARSRPNPLGRSELLAASTALVGFLAYSRATDANARRGNTLWWLVVASFLCLVASTLSKETGICMVTAQAANHITSHHITSHHITSHSLTIERSPRRTGGANMSLGLTETHTWRFLSPSQVAVLVAHDLLRSFEYETVHAHAPHHGVDNFDGSRGLLRAVQCTAPPLSGSHGGDRRAGYRHSLAAVPIDRRDCSGHAQIFQPRGVSS